MRRQIAVVDTGVANVRSLTTALERLGGQCDLTTTGERIQQADFVVLPGVGTFEAAIHRIDGLGLRESLRQRISADRPVLAICLGMQLLAAGSEESPGVPGLNVISAVARRFPDSVTVPQLGWNRVIPQSDGPISTGDGYFANSFRIETVPSGWRTAITTYGDRFVSSFWRGSCLACQFHPELSGAWGETILQNWLDQSSTTNGTQLPSSGLTSRVIPCLDVSHGRVVKGIQFASLRDAGDPAERARSYQYQGADELVILDVSATREDRGTMLETVARVRSEISIPVTVGGGVRSLADAENLLRSGADKISVNTAAVTRPDFIGELSARFGTQCTVVAVDAKRNGDRWQVTTHGGSRTTSVDVLQWLKHVESLGAGEILLTSHDRDGTGLGYDLELLAAARRVCRLPIIASGGAKQASDLVAAIRSGAHAVLAASILHDGVTTVEALKQHLQIAGIAVRA